jgi:hypothetical protein
MVVKPNPIDQMTKTVDTGTVKEPATFRTDDHSKRPKNQSDFSIDIVTK